MVSNETESMGHPTCVTSGDTYNSQTDLCYTCGGLQDDDGGSTNFGKVGYC